MSNTLIETVKTQLTKRVEAGALSNDELLRIIESEERIRVAEIGKPKVRYIPSGDVMMQQEDFQQNLYEKSCEEEKDDVHHTVDTPDTFNEPKAQEPTVDKVLEEVEGKLLSPTDQKKKEISEEIIALGGTPPEKGALKKFQKALEDLKASQEEEDETPEESTEDTEDVEETEEETQDEEEDDIDAFNDLMTEIQELFDRLEEEEKIEDMEVVTEITQSINKDAQSPDELSFAELKKFHAELKKFDK